MVEWPLEFDELCDEAKSVLRCNSSFYVYKNNGIIYFQEDEVASLYIVLSGYVRLSYLIENGTVILYEVVPPRQSFGELGVFNGDYYLDTATAVGEVKVMAIHSRVFNMQNEFKSGFQNALRNLISRRCRVYAEITKNLHLNTLSARLAQSILRLAKSMNNKMEYNGRKVRYLGGMVTQSDLGSMARGTRGNVNRILKLWKREGWIAICNRRIIILKPLELENLVFEEGF